MKNQTTMRGAQQEHKRLSSNLRNQTTCEELNKNVRAKQQHNEDPM